MTQTDVVRVREEFLGDPALALTVPQLARLLSISADDAKAIVETLEGEGWLVRSPAGMCRRAEPSFA